ncbi:hypothetical protein ACFY3K_00600 [Staphylococcus capitis]|uniref:hypothetical protein n=1 Tax=Staphylococcus capitis TaxID=29388 RepID=UPI0036804A53
MKVEIKGIPELERTLEREFGKKAMQRKSDKALVKATDFELAKLKHNFLSFKDTGASIEEMTRTKPYTDIRDGRRAVTIHWVGPKERYRLIHLNEHGYTRDGKKYIPRGYAVIEKTLQEIKSKYTSIVRKEMERKS